jgi:hypothetical protein
MRERKAPETRERERRRIARAINAALTEIRKHDPALARLLKVAIKTGQFFSYSPQRESEVKWYVELPPDRACGPQFRSSRRRI